MRSKLNIASFSSPVIAISFAGVRRKQRGTDVRQHEEPAVVHRVDDLAPGLYLLARSAAAMLFHAFCVITVAPMPAEKSAYALARYSRSPDSIRDSMEWVRTHNSEKFLESYEKGHERSAVERYGLNTQPRQVQPRRRGLVREVLQVLPWR